MNKHKGNQTYILIPTFNRRDILCATLAKVCAQLPSDGARLVVVNAGSTDGTRDKVLSEFPYVEIIEGHSDMWWTATVNHGIAYISKTARPDDKLLLMNDDIDIAPDALSNLLEASDLHSHALIGAVNLIHRPNDIPRVYFCGGRYDFHFARHRSNIMEGTPWQVQNSRFIESDFLYGRLLVIPWNIFDLGGRFDDINFPQYCADEDFSYSSKLLGFKILIDTQSLVYVNEDTTARFSLSFFKRGWRGVLQALISFNSCYNLKQSWAFAMRYAKWPIIYTICRYAIILINENSPKNKLKNRNFYND